LDYNSEGLLLLTNDGELARYLEHPTSRIERTYLVRVHGKVTQAHLEQFKRGSLIGGVQYGRMEATLVNSSGSASHNNSGSSQSSSKSATWIKVKLWEGKNREIRKVFEHFHMHVARLIRIQYGPYKLKSGLKRSQVRRVEIADYFKGKCSEEFNDLIKD